jgi:hypothetical protein
MQRNAVLYHGYFYKKERWRDGRTGMVLITLHSQYQKDNGRDRCWMAALRYLKT